MTTATPFQTFRMADSLTLHFQQIISNKNEIKFRIWCYVPKLVYTMHVIFGIFRFFARDSMTHKLLFISTMSGIELISTLYLYVDSRLLCQVLDLIIFQNK